MKQEMIDDINFWYFEQNAEKQNDLYMWEYLQVSQKLAEFLISQGWVKKESVPANLPTKPWYKTMKAEVLTAEPYAAQGWDVIQ